MAEIKEIKKRSSTMKDEDTDEIVSRTRRIFSASSSNYVETPGHTDSQYKQLQSQLAEKKRMLEQAASFGSQLVEEIDSLKKQFHQSTQSNIEKDELIKRYESQINILSESEKHAMHDNKIFQDRIETLENKLNELKNENEIYKAEKIEARTSTIESQNKTLTQKLIQITNEKDNFIKKYEKEEQKNIKLIKNIDELTNKISNLEQQNYELIEQNDELNKEVANNSEFIHEYQNEINKYAKENERLIEENNKLQIHLEEKHDEDYQDRQTRNRNNSFTRVHIGQTPISAKSHGSYHSGSFNFEENHLDNELSSLGEKGVGVNSVKNGKLFGRGISVNVYEDGIKKSDKDKDKINNNIVDNDAENEFIRLSILAAKIKYNIEIPNQRLFDQIKKEQIPFHEVADWLKNTLSPSHSHDGSNNVRITGYTETDTTPTQHFFKKLMTTMTNLAQPTMKLEVKFSTRVFEVKMKRNDKVLTLLQTLPRILGEKEENMVLYKGRTFVNPENTLAQMKLKNNDKLTMVHKDKAKEYLADIQKEKSRRKSLIQ